MTDQNPIVERLLDAAAKSTGVSRSAMAALTTGDQLGATSENTQPGPSADFCPQRPEGHWMATHFVGALVTVSRCQPCGWIDPVPMDATIKALIEGARQQAYEDGKAERDGDPGWVAGVRWAAAEADAQALGRGLVYIADITDHLRLCASHPDRRSIVPRDMAPVSQGAEEPVQALDEVYGLLEVAHREIHRRAYDEAELEVVERFRKARRKDRKRARRQRKTIKALRERLETAWQQADGTFMAGLRHGRDLGGVVGVDGCYVLPDGSCISVVECVHGPAMTLSQVHEAGYRAGRERAAEDVRAFRDQAKARCERYAAEISECARRSNECVVGAYGTAADIAAGVLDNRGRKINTDSAGVGTNADTPETTLSATESAETLSPRVTETPQAVRTALEALCDAVSRYRDAVGSDPNNPDRFNAMCRVQEAALHVLHGIPAAAPRVEPVDPTPRPECGSRIAHESGVVVRCINAAHSGTAALHRNPFANAAWTDDDDRVITGVRLADRAE